jgi:hypothetical protein
VNLPLDVDLILSTKRRLVSGRYPSSGASTHDGRLAENECLIVESLIRFFQDEPSKNQQLLICTEGGLGHLLERMAHCEVSNRMHRIP